jgi:hypothetical protein
MAGKAKYAERLAKHLGTPIDSSCAVARPGSTTAGAVTAGVGGAVGAAAATRVRARPRGATLNKLLRTRIRAAANRRLRASIQDKAGDTLRLRWTATRRQMIDFADLVRWRGRRAPWPPPTSNRSLFGRTWGALPKRSG